MTIAGSTSTESTQVLLIEDDADIRETIAAVLELEGYSVDTVSNGSEALTRLSGGYRPGLILLDLMMPVMDGWEFRRKQLLDDDLARIPTVVLSGDASVTKKAHSLGVAHSLGKPITIDALLGMVRNFCQGGQALGA
jgi:CheY-like chemotaxis protein